MATKVRTLKKLAAEGKTISFIAHTPGSERGVVTQSVMLRNAEVKLVKGNKYVITGRDLQLEAESDGIDHTRPIIRSFRIDRIVNRTIMAR